MNRKKVPALVSAIVIFMISLDVRFAATELEPAGAMGPILGQSALQMHSVLAGANALKREFARTQ